MRLAVRLLTLCWPAWALLILLVVTSAQLAGSRFYVSGQIAATIGLAWLIFVRTPFPRLGSKLVWLAACACLFAGAYGLDVERTRWIPWWRVNGFRPGTTLLNIDYPLIAASVIGLVSPVGMFGSTPILGWLRGYRRCSCAQAMTCTAVRAG